MRHSFAVAADIRAALRRFEKRTEACCHAHGITADQYVLMVMVKGADGERTTVNELAARLELASNGVAERVTRAAAAGLVFREPNPADARSSLIGLTPEGERRLLATYLDLGEELDVLLELLGRVPGRS